MSSEGAVGVVHEELPSLPGGPMGGGVRRAGRDGVCRSPVGPVLSVVQAQVGGVEDGDLGGGPAWRGLLRRAVVPAGAPCCTAVVKGRGVFDHTGSRRGGAVLIGRRAEGRVVAHGPPGWGALQLQDLKLLLWQLRHVVVLRGVGVPVGVRHGALGPSVSRGAVFWSRGGGRGSSAQSGGSNLLQLGLGGLDPAGGDVSVRAGGDGVGVVVGGGVALRRRRRCGALPAPPLRGGGGGLLLLPGELP